MNEKKKDTHLTTNLLLQVCICPAMHVTQTQTIKSWLHQLKYKSATCRKNNVLSFKNCTISSLFYTIIHKADFNLEIGIHAV
jgi:hypothetical protein